MRAACVEQSLAQLFAGLHDRVAGDVSHAARPHAAIARRRVGVADNHAHLIDPALFIWSATSWRKIVCVPEP